MRRCALAVAAVVVGTTLAPPAGAGHDCSNVPAARQKSDAGILHTEDVGLASGRYALPDTAQPAQLVVMMHGYTNNSCAFRDHLRNVAARGAIGIAMDYTGQDPVTARGWRVAEGAADSIEAVRWFMDAYPSITETFVLGISMGGNASGLAVSSPAAVRADGSPLFDHWVAIEGVHNLVQEYFTFRFLSAEFDEDVRAETGGTFEEVPQRYVELSNVANAASMGYLRNAVLVHGVDDLLVAYNQSRDMAAALRTNGVPADLYTVLGRGDGEDGDSIVGLAGEAAFTAADLGPFESPLAGHGWEGSNTQLVIRTGFEQLWALMDGKQAGPYREFVVHGENLTVGVP